MSEIKHYGVKGMRWGVRKNKSRAAGLERIAEIEKQASKSKLSGQDTWTAAIERAHFVGKEHKRLLKKNPNYDPKKETREERDAREKRITRKAKTTIALITTVEAGAAFAIGKAGGKYLFGLNDSYSTKSGAAFTAAIIAARGKQFYRQAAYSNQLARSNEVSDIRKDIGLNKLTSAQKAQRAATRAKNQARKLAKQSEGK